MMIRLPSKQKREQKMKYKIIGSGSKGNALLLENKILIDCGVSYRKIKNEDIKIVLLTHEHSDHLNKIAVRQFAQNRPMTRWCCPPYLVQSLVARGVDKSKIDVIKTGETLDYRAFQVTMIDLIHDVPNCGYTVKINGEKALYMTDTGTADHVTAKDYDYYFIEANYREQELKATIEQKLKNGEFSYETRVADTHLSEEQAIDFIIKNASDKSKVIYIHRHAEKE